MAGLLGTDHIGDALASAGDRCPCSVDVCPAVASRQAAFFMRRRDSVWARPHAGGAGGGGQQWHLRRFAGVRGGGKKMSQNARVCREGSGVRTGRGGGVDVVFHTTAAAAAITNGDCGGHGECVPSAAGCGLNVKVYRIISGSSNGNKQV